MSDSINSHVNIENLSSQIATTVGEERFLLLARRAKAYRLNNDNRAIIDYVDIIEDASDPRLVCHAQSMLALISIEAGELKEALWWAMTAVNTDRTQFDGHMAVGLALDAGSLYEASIHFFRRALEVDQTSEIALLKLAKCCREVMRFSEANDAFDLLLSVCPDNPTYHYECGRNWQLRHDVNDHYERALEFYEKALNCDPNEELKRKIQDKIRSLPSQAN